MLSHNNGNELGYHINNEQKPKSNLEAAALQELEIYCTHIAVRKDRLE